MNESDNKTIVSLLATIGSGFAIKTITGSDTLGVLAFVVTGLYMLSRK
jgi:hypothetical protein